MQSATAATATAMHAASACTRKLAITGGQSSQQTIYYIVVFFAG